MREFTAVFKQTDGWWVGWAEELPGAFGQGRDLDAARASLRAAIEMMLEELRADSADQSLRDTES